MSGITFLLRTLLAKFNIHTKFFDLYLKVNSCSNPTSLAAIGIVLKSYGFDYIILKFNDDNTFISENLADIKYPFIIHFKKKNKGFALVVKHTKQQLYIVDENGIESIVKFSNFFDQFSGVVLLPSKKHHIPLFKSKKFTIWATIIRYLILFSFIALFISIYSNNVILLFLTIIKFIGVLLSILILSYSNGHNLPIVASICNVFNTDCRSVTNASRIVIAGVGINWAFGGLFYFGSSLIILLLGTYDIASSILLLKYFNYFTLLFSLYSIYAQKYIFKKWCVLCLITLIIFYCEFYLILKFEGPLFLNLNYLFVISFLLLLLLVLSYYILLNYNIKLSYENKIVKLLGVKYNEGVFNYLQSGLKMNFNSAEPIKIFGNDNARHSLTLILSPNCKPCRRAYLEIKKYMTEVYANDLSVYVIIYKSKNDNKLDSINPMLLAIDSYLSGNIQSTVDLLDNWSRLGTVMPSQNKIKNTNNVTNILNAQRAWCSDNNIKYTPTIYFNSIEIPKNYTLEDMDFLISM